ncbi:MAG: hypothetical protein J7K65_02925 [Planctomycetes bacterium]|nr:hypothetical protein [Planctomycetota bacterium]
MSHDKQGCGHSSTVAAKCTAEVHRRGLIPLQQTELTLQQIDLPEKLYTVIDHRVQLYRTPDGTIIKATLPKSSKKRCQTPPSISLSKKEILDSLR